MSDVLVVKRLELLVHKISAEIDQVLLERYGIGYSQYKVLDIISTQNGCSQKFVANSLLQTEASISRQVKILVSKNLIIINIAKSDNRKKVLNLTPRGLEVFQKSTKVIVLYSEHMQTVLSKKEQQAFNEILSKI